MGEWNTRAEAEEYYKGMSHALHFVLEDLYRYRDMPERVIKDLNEMMKRSPERYNGETSLNENDIRIIREENRQKHGDKIDLLEAQEKRLRDTLKVIDHRIETEHPLEEEY